MLFLLTIALSPALWAQSKLLIHGQVLPKHRKVYLLAFDHNTLAYRTLDSQKITKQYRFQFRAPFSQPNLYKLSFDHAQSVVLSVEDKRPISVTMSETGPIVEGSPNTTKMLAFAAEQEALQGKYFAQLKQDLDKAMAGGDKAKAQSLMQEADLALAKFLVEFRSMLSAFGSTPAGYQVLQYSDFNKEIDYIQTRLAQFKQEAPGTEYTLALEMQVNQVMHTSVGKVPPGFSGTDLHGNPVALADFKGKVVLLDFWASWCRACRVENPHFAQLYDQYRNQDFEIISISKDEKKSNWLAAVEKDGIGAWKQLWDMDESISKSYSISSLPQNFLLGKDGKIMAKNIDAAKLGILLSKMFNP